MTDRMDIDALLIGALYGELTPAEEAQLTAHLESHPADRTALADLTETRATVRESGLFTVRFDPPQSGLALLLQEAARRAPKPASETAGWFHRFTRSFMMHPAMAAAAMLVLVVGVAGTLYLRHGDQMFAEPAPPRAATSHVSAEETLSTTTPTATPVAGATAGVPEPAPATAASGSAAGADAYRVGLASDGSRQKLEVKAPSPSPASPRDEQQLPAGGAKDDNGLLADRESKDGRKAAKGGDVQGRAPEPEGDSVAKAEAPSPKPARPAKPVPTGSLGIEVPGHEMMPKELPVDDDRGGAYAKNGRAAATDKADQKAASKRSFSNADADSARASANAQQPPGGAAGGGAATAAPGMIPPQNHAAAGPAADPGVAPAVDALRSPANDAQNNARNNVRNDAKAKAPAKTVSRSNATQAAAPSAQPASPPPPPSNSNELSKFRADNRQQANKLVANQANAKPADVKLADENGEDKALIGWAQKQRDQVLALVRSNNCRAAANAAIEIYNRAPDYYAANVETDRSIKPCIVYVNNEREKAERSRAKRVNAVDTPAQAAPPPATRK